MGRRSEYTPEIGLEICELIASGEHLRTICEMDGMPEQRTVYRWLNRHEEFGQNYARAMTSRADKLFEETIDIADDAAKDLDTDGKVNWEAVQRAKLRIDTRKWAVGKMNPRKYGERSSLELSGPSGGPVQVITTDMTPEEAAKAWQASLDAEAE